MEFKEPDENFSMRQNTKYKQRYRKEWEEIPAFRGWLAPVPENSCIAFCKSCKSTFTAKLSDIRVHSSSKKHQQALQGHFPKRRMTMTKMHGLGSLEVSEILSLYKELARIPVPENVHITYNSDSESITLQSTWTIVDVEQNRKTQFTRCHAGKFSMENALNFEPVGLPQDSSSQLFTSYSPSGSYKAVLRKLEKNNESKQFVEFWDLTTKMDSVDIEAVGAHGAIYDDTTFGTFAWSNGENQILYVAEKKQKKKVSYFKRQSNDFPHNDVEVGSEFEYREDWGEQLVGKCDPVLCTMNIYTSSVNVIKNVPEDVSPGQAIWAPDDTGIVFVGWVKFPWKLGLVYCNNRKNRLYYLDFETLECNIIGGDDKNVHSPRFSPDGQTLVYLQSEIGGPHRQANQLVKYNWETKETVVVVDIVKSPVGNEFPGLYLETLPFNCWSDNSTIYLSSCWHSKWEVLGINVDSAEIVKLSRDETVGYWKVMTVTENFIVAAASSLNCQPQLLVAALLPGGAVTNWVPVDMDACKIAGISWYILQFSPPDESNMIFESTLVMPKNQKSLPLIVWPHGGPHSSSHAGFQLYPVLFVKCGFAVLLVNYRGSIGFGEDNLKSLIGKIGQQDVFDVQCAAEVAAQRDEIDPSKTVIFGGSHGGFLACHAIGQFPEFYRACAVLNPVVDVASMVGTTDITDWPYVESGIESEFKHDSVPEPATLEIMWKKSPMRYIKNARVPTMIHIGTKDLRVSPSQGMRLYKILQSQGVITKLYTYEDNHSLKKTDIEADVFVNTVLWFKKHLGLF